MNEVLEIRPQAGPQTEFLTTSADVAVYGGSAGGGKTFGLLAEPLRHVENPEFGGVIFRKTSVQVRNQGGLWDESMKLYAPLSATPVESFLQWTFPSGMRIKFSHLERDSEVLNWQGSQIPFLGFDELTHFSEYQFFYMFSRNRSTSGVPGYIRATCNPDPDSWVRRFISWWIDDEGYPRKERSGQLRWFLRRDDQIFWEDHPEVFFGRYGKTPEVQPKSFTFIPSNIYDNKILMEKDPAYLANLMALPYVDRMRLLYGNWNVRASAGTMFRREWCKVIDTIPGGWIRAVRFWDRAATKPNPSHPDPDWTRGLKMYQYPNGTFLVADLKSTRDTPGKVEELVKAVASHDTQSVRIKSQQDPGSAGVSEAEHFTRMLAGYDVRVETMSKDKTTRAKPVSAQCEAGNVLVLRAGWNEEFFQELEAFPEGRHDDIVDVLSGAFNELCTGASLFDVL